MPSEMNDVLTVALRLAGAQHFEMPCACASGTELGNASKSVFLSVVFMPSQLRIYEALLPAGRRFPHPRSRTTYSLRDLSSWVEPQANQFRRPLSYVCNVRCNARRARSVWVQIIGNHRIEDIPLIATHS